MKRWGFALLICFVFLSLACNLGGLAGGGNKATAEPTQPPPPATPTTEPTTPPPTAQPTAALTETPAGNSGSGGAVDNLKDAEKAVIRIVTQGSYEFAGYGSYEQSYTGSGFIVDPSGLAITNNHVVTGAALVEVYFNGNPKPFRAKVLGSSECSDLAVIKIEGENFPYLEWYTGAIDLGLDVYSLGYPLGDPEYTQHKGTISKKNAASATNWTDVNNVVEHDALINPGSSGGPLVTKDAKVVGINYASLQSANQYYAITYQEAKTILDTLTAGKDYMAIGLNGEAFKTEDNFTGIWIYSVKSGSPADKTGMKAGDILLDMEGLALAKQGTMTEYCGILRGKDPSAVLGVKVVRAKTGEVLEGQINGRELAVTGKLNVPKEDSSNATPAPTQASGQLSSDYFTDEFNSGLDKWKTWVSAGDTKKNFVEGDAGQLVFTLPSAETYTYVENTSFSYSDVYVEAQYNLVRTGDSGVAVICRGSQDGWYELRVHSSGLYAGTYEVYRYDPNLKARKQNPYVKLFPFDRVNSVSIKNGTLKNVIGMSCVGTDIHIFINGVEQIPPNKKIISDDRLTSGTVGVGGMSFSGGDVKINVEYLKTTAP